MRAFGLIALNHGAAEARGFAHAIIHRGIWGMDAAGYALVAAEYRRTGRDEALIYGSIRDTI